jgi:putative salt-induced outer membrane protein YdiY
MVGVTTATTSESDGGGRYNSFNPDLILTWQCLSNLQLYAEVYGQTKTGPGQSNGFNGDTGIQYLLTDHIELDVEYGQRFNGQLDGFARYVGAGAGFMF